MDRPIVVKLGGSILTRKRERERLRPKVIQRLATELFQGWNAGGAPLVVIHGAGSFGHPGAAQWGLAGPPGSSRNHRERGAALTSHRVRDLHQRVVKELLSAGLPAFSVPPFPLAKNREGNLVEFPMANLTEVLERGGIPVTFGDVVRDSAWGFSILSGDTIAVRMAREISLRQMVFVSDVPGVFAPGSESHRTVIRELGPELLAGLSVPRGHHDVTGGIRAKVQAMLEIAEGGARAGLISGLTHGNVLRALRGEEVYGSWTRRTSP